AGIYKAYARVKAIDPASNSLWMRVNGGKWVPWDDIKLSPLDNPAANYLPVIPGGQGYGMETPAGRGGQVIKVTNLNDSGSGSLRACVQANGPRVCVFEVSGFVNLNSPLVVRNPYLTIAGQTAPSPGIMLGRGHGMQIWTHDVLVQHIGVRPGDGPGTNYRNRDGLQINGTDGPNQRPTNIVLDHVTLAWGMDESLDMWGYIGDITVKNCIIAQAMRDPFEIEGQPSYGNLIGPYDQQSRVCIYGSYYVGNRDRQPLSRSKTLLFSNNLLYDRVLRFVYLSNRDAYGSGGFSTNSTVVGNAFVEGPDMSYNLPHERPVTFDKNGQQNSSKLYVADNWWSEVSYNNQWSYVKDANSSIQANNPPAWINNFQYEPNHQKVIDHVSSQAGARPLDRNYLDRELLKHFDDRTAAVVTCVSGCARAAGGWPVLASNYRELELPNNPNGDDDQDGYTNLEEWLHAFARGVETGEGEYVWDQVRDADNGNSPLLLNLQSGTNVIEVAVKEAGIRIDKFMLSPTSGLPSGPGPTGVACDTTTNGGGGGGGTGTTCYLPDDWFAADIGSVNLNGSACYDSTTTRFQMAASGADIWGTADAFQYAFRPMSLTQDFSATVQVNTIDFTDPWAKAGVMIRTGLGASAKNVLLYTSAEGRWSFQRRLTTAGTTVSTKSNAGVVTWPYWLRLTLEQGKVRGEVSADGLNWTQVEEVNLAVDTELYVGLAVTSHNNQTIANASFESFSLGAPSNEQTFPVELLSFDVKGEPANGRARVSWVTAQEENNAFFTVERSIDGVAYIPLQQVNSQGSGQTRRDYLIYDEQPVEGKSYYRLKQTDLDGTFEYFAPVSLLFDKSLGFQARFYPNPLRDDRRLTAEIWATGSESLRFELYNPLGQLVWSQTKSDIVSGWQVVSMDLKALNPGLYVMKIADRRDRNAQIITQQILLF
ncbi:MAG: T9SS type A sorting domain-containing protein, partial [Bacteroidota bacterium]